MMAGAIIAVSAWAIVLAWLVVTLLRSVLREHARQQELRLAAAKRAAREQAEHARRERLLAQQRQIEALDALAELPSASHRGGRTR